MYDRGTHLLCRRMESDRQLRDEERMISLNSQKSLEDLRLRLDRELKEAEKELIAVTYNNVSSECYIAENDIEMHKHCCSLREYNLALT